MKKSLGICRAKGQGRGGGGDDSGEAGQEAAVRL